ncbi:acetyl xylan esterase [Coprinopsis cinerea AmutBmut pab1-1]|nr:acetyl xylan esterase [Coprinopsis cinerea AmutBmut pab1-1]
MAKFTTLLSVVALALTSVNAVPLWGQCGGNGYTGSTQCDAGLICVRLNDWYSQCQQGSGQPQPPVTTPAPPVTTPAPPVTTPAPPVTTPQPPPPATTPPAQEIPAGQLTRLQNFGSNPSNVQIHVYKPSSIKAGAGLLVALHPCGGTAQQYFSGFGWRAQADQRGFLVFYGQTTQPQNCWDVTSSATLRHDGGSDSLGIANAVRYAIRTWGIDPNKVFVTGTSSGAMMTNVMAGVYPELFKAGAVFAGVGLGCLQTGNTPAFPPDPCAAGNRNLTPKQWGDLVRAAYPGYTGPYPRMQIWHGTADPILNINNFQEQVEQWTDVHGISQTPASTSPGTPRQSWTKTSYGSGQVEAFNGQGAGHGLPESGTEATAINFFGL